MRCVAPKLREPFTVGVSEAKGAKDPFKNNNYSFSSSARILARPART